MALLLTRPDLLPVPASNSVAPGGTYLATLDGWRALAVISVILYHDRAFCVGPVSDGLIHRFGFLGVELFFAISGLLICSRLVQEEKTRGRMNFRHFYIRRFWRIMPASLIYLGTIAILGGMHFIVVNMTSWIAALVFYRNYYSAHLGKDDLSPYTNHFWSLSVEEHFYILLPPLLLLAAHRRGNMLAVLSVCSIFYAELICHIPILLEALGGKFAERRTDLHLSALLTGASLAVMLLRPPFRAWCNRWLTPGRCLFGFMLAWSAVHCIEQGIGARLAAPLGFPFVILSTVLHPRSLLGRLLELPLLRFLGRISYSLYLWQQLFFIGDYPGSGGWMSRLQSRPYNIFATFSLAVASYYLIERPFIRVGHKLTSSKRP